MEQTAEEFIKNRYDWSSKDLERWRDLMSGLPMADAGNVVELMVEFARIKAQEALQAATSFADQWENSGTLAPEILGCYPLDKIK